MASRTFPEQTARPSMPTQIAVLGSINLDSVIRVPRAPAPGETISGREARTFVGGKGANQAVAASLAGAAVEMIGSVGDDAAGHNAIVTLDGYGVGVDHVRTSTQAPTGVAHVLVTDDGENLIVLAPGANATFTSLPLAALGAIAWADVLMLQLEVPLSTSLQAAIEAVRLDVYVVLTPAPAVRLPAELLSTADLIVPNEVEVAQLTGEDDPDSACQALADLGIDVLNTRGRAGSFWFGRDGLRVHAPALDVEAVDTTGAGDCYVANFVAEYARTCDVEASMRWASQAAALSVQTPGATPSMPTRAAVEAAIAAHEHSTTAERKS